MLTVSDVLPLIRLGLDSPTHSVVDASIKTLPVFLPVLDFSTVKNEVFPPIASTFSRTSSLAIKVRSLEAFAVLCGGSASESDDELSGVLPSNTKQTKSSILDKYTMQEKLVPALKAIKTKEPSVMMASLKVFREVGKVADTDFLALEVLPVLWSFSLGPLLNLQQFNDFMGLIKSLSTKIENEQRRKLQELSSAGDSGGFQNGKNSFSQSATDLTSSDVDSAKSNFERLVLGKGAAPSASNNDTDIWGSMEPDSASKRASASPSFSWSTNDARSQAGQPSFRSITPDQKLNSFPSLAPARQPSPASSAANWGTQAMPAMQPLKATQPMQPMQPSTSTWGAQPISTNSTSLASLSGMNSGVSRPAHQQGSNYSAFSIPPPPSGIAPNAMRSPLGMHNTPASFPAQPAQQPPTAQKSGLDKYESLL